MYIVPHGACYRVKTTKISKEVQFTINKKIKQKVVKTNLNFIKVQVGGR